MGEVVAAQLTALVGTEDFRPAIARERVLERLDTKRGSRKAVAAELLASVRP
jgi:hypothetical protein